VAKPVITFSTTPRACVPTAIRIAPQPNDRL